MTTATITDCADPVFDICERLGLEPDNVLELVVRPYDVRAKLALLNENGAKYFDEDRGEVATTTRTFQISTHRR